MAFLVIQRPGHTDETFPLASNPIRVGRLPDNDLAIDEQSVSRHHAVISPEGEGHTVADLGSRNGVWINGQRVADTPVPLREGDEVALGGKGVVLRYFSDESAATDVTAFITQLPWLEKQTTSTALPEGERWMKLIRVTPLLRFVAAATGAAAAVLALAWWILRFLVG